jgi:hypothetical protein
MKKISILFASFLFLLPITSNASVLFSQAISLTPGWNIVSTPRVLESHAFSVAETSNNFDIYVLNASSTSGWSTLASIGQTEFTPLFGYFVNNKSGATTTLTLNYKNTASTPNARIFERTFTKTGWYSIGVANSTYAKKVTDDSTDTNNPSSVLNSLAGGYESVLDLTNQSFSQNPNSVAVNDTWKQAIASDVNSINDLRESKGYVVYVNQANALYSGFQNNDIPPSISSIPPVITLIGANPQSIQTGATYTELGATVTDNLDTGLVATINASNVNTAVAGTYSVTYNVTDSNGNPATQVTRTVYVTDTAQPPVVTFSSYTPSSSTVDAGTQAYTIWSGVMTVGTRAVNLNSASFKSVGSAPYDAINNINLYVDGSLVGGPSTVNPANSNKVTFDLGGIPYYIGTGSHTLELRGDVVKGAARNVYFSVENASDVVFGDPAISNVSITGTGLTNLRYNTININQGSLVVNVDPAFTTSNVTGGASNVSVGQFTLKAYGEDIKVNSLQLTFATTSIPTLNNVALYVNGGQIGTSLNWLGISSLTYSLGSSLIVPAGQTVTLSVKADLVDINSAAYASGTIATKLVAGSYNAQGQSSNMVMSVPVANITGGTLTVASGVGTFAKTAGFIASNISSNTSNVKIGSFTVQSQNSEGITINSIGVNPNAMVNGVSSSTNISNLTVKDGSTVLGTPVGMPVLGTSTFSVNITVPANSTKTFDVYADIGTASTGSTTASMSITSSGLVSRTTSMLAAAGVTITSVTATLSPSTLVSSSPVAQFIVGGSTFGIATYKIKTATDGTVATVRELHFSTTGTDAVTSITVAGVTAAVVAGNATVSGLNLAVSSTGTDVPVTVHYSGFLNSTSGGTLTQSLDSNVTLTYVEAVTGGSVITETTSVPSNTMTLVASKPTVTVSSTQGGTLNLGAENKVGEFTVTADANGKISISSVSLNLATIGFTSPEFTSARIADGNTTIAGSSVTGSSTMVIAFSSPYEIAAGTSRTFSVYSTVNGSVQQAMTPYVVSSMASASAFNWNDMIGGNSAQTGTKIYNFPTNSYTTLR